MPHANSVRSNYYSPHSFAEFKKCFSTSNVQTCFSILHNNVRSLRCNFEKLETHLLDELDYSFDIISITETKITNSTNLDINVDIVGYNF